LLPNHRISKFQDLMPEWLEQEVLGRYLFARQAAPNCCPMQRLPASLG
jgi:hypothetical protein